MHGVLPGSRTASPRHPGIVPTPSGPRRSWTSASFLEFPFIVPPPTCPGFLVGIALIRDKNLTCFLGFVVDDVDELWKYDINFKLFINQAENVYFHQNSNIVNPVIHHAVRSKSKASAITYSYVTCSEHLFRLRAARPEFNDAIIPKITLKAHYASLRVYHM